TFEPHVDFPAGEGPVFVALADFNRDGKPDLAVADQSGNQTLVFLQSAVSLSPTAINFGNQNVGTTSQPQAVTLTNNTGAVLNIPSFTFTGADSGDFGQTNTCGSSVPAGGQCTINITFTPTFPLSRSAFLNINDNDPTSPQLVSLSGTGIGPAVTF